jgi:cobalt-precorrin 5A hydrolase
MRVAGLGFRKAAGVSALREALALAGGNVSALATAEAKADAAALVLLAQELGVPVIGVPLDALAAAKVNTHSRLVKALYNTGSVAEAAALAAAGPGAILTGPRVTSRNGMATAAIAERIDE